MLPKTPIVQVLDLSVRLKNRSILERVNFSVQQGSIHAIMGSNGAGKTTLIRSLLGSMPHQGEISFYFKHQGGIGYVPQFIEFDHSLPISVNDFFHILRSKKPVFLSRKKTHDYGFKTLLEKIGCLNLLDRSMGSLSGGELRRVLIAQALIRQPELLFLDEPDSNLDELAVKELESLLRSLREQGVTVILVGHDVAMICRVADYVTQINKSVIFSGTINEFQALPNFVGIGSVDRSHSSLNEVSFPAENVVKPIHILNNRG